MECPDEKVASGAFYSEDWVKKLITTGQRVVAEMETHPLLPGDMRQRVVMELKVMVDGK